MAAEITAQYNLSDEIYHYLREQIVMLQMKPGEKLSEVALSRQFNCSRIPVREAVRQLASDGALIVKPQRGSFVSPIHLKHLEQIRFLREILETHIILEAFDAGVLPAILPYLQSLVNRQAEFQKVRSFENLFRLDMEFHSIFYSVIQKDFVLSHTGSEDIHYTRARLLGLHLETNRDIIVQHQEILDAIKAQDRNALEKSVKIHLKNVNHMLSEEMIAEKHLRSYFTYGEEENNKNSLKTFVNQE